MEAGHTRVERDVMDSSQLWNFGDGFLDPQSGEQACMCTGKSAYHIHVPHWSHDHPPLWCAEWFAVVYYIPHLGITQDKTVDEKL